jgi:protein CWC15
MSRNIPIPTATKRAIDVPTQKTLLFREPASSTDREELKRKLEAAESSISKRKLDEEVEAPLPIGPGTHIEPQSARDEQSASEPSISDEEGSEYSSEDEEELLRELSRIKQERAEAEAIRLAQEAARERAIKEQEVASGNPLIGGGVSALRRRWDDDTVFRGQASGVKREEKKFVNDVVRTGSHKKFLGKYVV